MGWGLGMRAGGWLRGLGGTGVLVLHARQRERERMGRAGRTKATAAVGAR